MAVLNILEAVKAGLRQELKRDRNVVVLGEDVGRNGGVFRATDGLQAQFGEDRVIDTPLAELGIVASAIGMAAYGMKPVAEIQFDGFTYSALDPLINHAARMRTRSRGRFTCPMVLRFPYSGGIRALEHHSESPETYYVHTPGLSVVVPSTPYDTKGLLASAIRDPDPVIFMEPKRIYRAIKEEVPDEEYTVPLGKANIVQEGDDITMIAWGSMLKTAKEAVEQLGGKQSIEIIDPRTLKPLDVPTIINSVKKTGRAVIVQEAPRTCGFASELIALINDKALLDLQAPVQRVTGFDVPFPLYKLENYYLPDQKRIIKAINQVMSFG